MMGLWCLLRKATGGTGSSHVQDQGVLLLRIFLGRKGNLPEDPSTRDRYEADATDLPAEIRTSYGLECPNRVHVVNTFQNVRGERTISPFGMVNDPICNTTLQD